MVIPRRLVVLGATGFLGRAFLLLHGGKVPIQAIARTPPSHKAAAQRGVAWRVADLSIGGSLDDALQVGDCVVNLAYLYAGTERENLALIENVVAACVRRGVSRIVHCSTAVVAGRTTAKRIDESTPCVPYTAYEKTKLAVEGRIFAALNSGIDVGILRPTAIVGPGGQNLRKLAVSLLSASSLSNYLRSSLFGKRPMHLVPVRNVADALAHLALSAKPLAGNLYLAAADDDPENTFQTVEKQLREALGLPERRVPVFGLPNVVLSSALRLLRRSDGGIDRYFDASKLYAGDFAPIDSVATAVREFGRSFGTDSL